MVLEALVSKNHTIFFIHQKMNQLTARGGGGLMRRHLNLKLDIK